MAEVNYDLYKRTRFLYILEAAFEYFISLMVMESYLAKIATSIGISDSITGVLYSFLALGGCFQILALFIKKRRRVKGWVIIMHLLNQSLFVLLYAVPIINIDSNVKIILFVLFLLVGTLIAGPVGPIKIDMFMKTVPDKDRGKFTANKEIFSLISAMFFSLGMGSLIDAMEAKGKLETAFFIISMTILFNMICHTLTIVFSKERVVENCENKISFKKIFANHDYVKVIILFSLWSIAKYTTRPFYGTYSIGELGFSMTALSILFIVYSVVRATASHPFGSFADKHSFTNLLLICFSVSAVGMLIMVFCNPENGKVLYPLYYVLDGIAMAGAGSATINLVYEKVSIETRVPALAISNCISDGLGFLATLAVSPLVSYIQNNNNTFLGIHAYAQQILSAFGFILLIIAILFLYFAFLRKKEKNTAI